MLPVLCRLHTAMFHWPLSSAATKEVQGPDTTWRRLQGLLPWPCWQCMGTICTLCPSSQKQVIRKPVVWASPPPPPEQPGQSPLPPPSGTYSTPCKDEDRGQASQRLFFILQSMKQCPILFSKTSFSSCFNFWMCKHTISCSYFFIIFWIILNMFQMLVLIMFKTSRFWPLV